MQYLTERDGPIAWITSGKVDAVLDICFGRDPAEEPDIQALLGEIAANLSAVAKGSSGPEAGGTEAHKGVSALSQRLSPERIPGQRALVRPALTAPTAESELEQEPNDVAIDIDFRFRDLKAAVPLFTRDLSYTRNALIRPIVAFIK
jgi:distribution and morphology protein 31